MQPSSVKWSSLPRDHARSLSSSFLRSAIKRVLEFDDVEDSQLIAAFAILVAKYSGKDEIAFPFITESCTTPILIDVALTPGMTKQELLAEVSRSCISSKEASSYGASLLVQVVQDQKRFRSLLASSDICINFNSSTKLLSFSYDVAIFEEETVNRFFDNYIHILSMLISRADFPIRSISLIADYVQASCRAPTFASSVEPTELLHHSFERIAAKFSDKVAVSFGGASLTYLSLNQRAAIVATNLANRGVQHGDRIAICLWRGTDFIIAMIGVLKIGCTYVPVDPDYPYEKKAAILQNSGCKLAIVAVPDLEKLSVEEISIESCIGAADEKFLDTKNLGGSTAQTAYVLYTSGSTGIPKGVCVSHANVARLFHSTESVFRYSPSDVWSVFHSFAFDFSVWEVWGGLFYGGTILVTSSTESRDPEAFLRLIRDEKVTILSQTPSAFRQLLQEILDLGERLPSTVRFLIFGGEKLPSPLLADYFEHVHNDTTKLVNMYGITETTVHVTLKFLSRKDCVTPVSNVGYPLNDMEILLLDSERRPVTRGAVGEIYVAGAGVTKGYLGRSDLTEERFLTIPGASPFNHIFYRSGDLGRILLSGELEYLGRNDTQVKVSGYRIEIGEIEEEIRKFPGIRAVHVMAVPEANQSAKLYAFYISQCAGQVEVTKLRDKLRIILPQFMVPAHFVEVEKFPLTKNGKLDSSKLLHDRNLQLGNLPSLSIKITPDERRLIQIWESVLSISGIDVEESFFNLGGDSLRAVQIIGRGKKEGIKIKLEDLIRGGSIRKLAASMSEIGFTNQLQPFALVTEDERKSTPFGANDIYPAGALQLGMLYHTQLHPNRAIFRDVFRYDLEGTHDNSKLTNVINQIISKHESLRTGFALGGEHRPLQFVMANVEVNIPEINCTGFAPNEVNSTIEALFSKEKATPFDINHPPLFRFHVVKSTGSWTLIFSCHHAILDGWSVASFITEVLKSYDKELQGQPLSLRSPQSRVADFIALELEASTSSKNSDLWKAELKTENEVQSIRQFVKEEQLVGHGSVRVSIEDSLLNPLIDFARLQNLPLRSVVFAAHISSIAYVTNSSSVCTGLVSNGRPETEDGDQVLGLFLNTLPFVQDIADPTWCELVRTVFEKETRLTSIRRYPYSKLLEENASLMPFESAFNFVDFRIYDELSSLNIKLLKTTFHDETDIPLLVYFGRSTQAKKFELLINYDRSKISREIVNSFQSAFIASLEQLGKSSDQKWRKTDLRSPSDICFQELVLAGRTSESQSNFDFSKSLRDAAEQFSSLPALRFDATQFTYAELNYNALKIATMLKSRGIARGSVVALHCSRSVEMVAGLLGIIYSGATCLPIDPSLPKFRIHQILADARPSVSLVTADVQTLAETDAGVALVIENIVSDSPTPKTNVDHVSTRRPDDLLYILYTSGSTGSPKGVCMQDEAIANLLQWQVQLGYLSQGTQVLQFASLGFDVSFQEVLCTLMTGGCLHLIPHETRRNIEELTGFLAVKKIQVAFLPPFVLAQVAEYALSKSLYLPELKRVVTAGDKLEITGAIRAFSEQHHNFEIENQYGPTETHVVTSYLVPKSKISKSSFPPIGSPIPNVRISIRATDGRPTATGCAGELFISGRSVARGYKGNINAKEERFSIDSTSGARCYKTGDLVRLEPDGLVTFLGRNDAQVKIRGYRVELEEIEAIIRSHPTVSEVAVRCRQTKGGGVLLEAFVVNKTSSKEIDPTLLRTYLLNHLPEHMVPSGYFSIDKIPLNLNGKLDRRAVALFEAPTDAVRFETKTLAPIEKTISIVWEELLGHRRFNSHHRFFEVGGNSLLLFQVYLRIKYQLNLDFPLVSLFQFPTVAGLSTYLTDLQQGISSPARVPVSQVPPENRRKMSEILRARNQNARHKEVA